MNNTRLNPPKWGDRMLQWYCSEHYLEEIQGDLHEWFHKRVDRQGLAIARALYFLDVIRFFRTFRLKSMDEFNPKPNNIMWMNNIKLAIRNFRRKPLLPVINAFGLSLLLE